MLEWKISQDTQHCSYFGESQERWRRINFSLKSSKIAPSSCRCTMTLIVEKQETKRFCMSNSSSVAANARRLREGSFLGPENEEKLYGKHIYKPNGSWNHVADLMMDNLRENGHPLFRGTRCVVPRIFENRRNWKNRCPTTAELLFRTLISINRLGIYGAVADWCTELALQISDHSSSSTRKLVNLGIKGRTHCCANWTNSPLINVPAQGNLLRQHKERFGNLPEDNRVSKAGDDAGLIRKVSP